MILDGDIIKAYNLSRVTANNRLVCHAPFTNLNFEQTGEVRACCYNFKNILGKWPQQSIREIWQGAQLNNLRKYINNNNFGGGCLECGRMIAAGNHQGVRARYYDEFADGFIKDKAKGIVSKFTGGIVYPKVIEFELSNTCNLECVMCNGSFSSSIRKNREKLPAIVSPYNDKFVDELEEFIPHLTDAKFLGGEPFMIDIYLKIWERMLKLNPGIRIHITTNGTFLNSRIKDLLEGLNAGIILSIDSVNKVTYEKIRVNGSFEKVMDNLEYFIDYTKRKKTFLSIASCPITYNWREMPELLQFCLQKNIILYFNAVFTPESLSLREQTADYLAEVVGYLDSYKMPLLTGSKQSPRNLSISAYADYVSLLKGWLNDKIEWNKRVEEVQDSVAETTTKRMHGEWLMDDLAEAMVALNAIQNEDQHQQKKNLQIILGELLADCPEDKLFDVLVLYINKGGQSNNVPMDKIVAIAGMINSHPKRSEILLQTGQLPPVMFAALLVDTSIEHLKENLFKHFA